MKAPTDAERRLIDLVKMQSSQLDAGFKCLRRCHSGQAQNSEQKQTSANPGWTWHLSRLRAVALALRLSRLRAVALALRPAPLDGAGRLWSTREIDESQIP